MDGSRQGRFGRSAQRFAAYFQELRGAFLEREDVLSQIALALLSREHVLLVGPPGTAKSQLARAVLGRILDATTGEPSLFARQFTENTVLTDLVGPIDFKTLMETGRSQHFTDEGVIGSVHAFLDEVFDGRDMLLRSTLNLLGERELKQGKTTVRGRIECSLMTSNRYLTEVLEESRESLLAFVDRIAFVGFVPKGFSSPAPMRQVMRQSLSGGAAPLHAYLTIQDLDALQEVVDRLRIPAEVSDRLVAFLDAFEAEMAAAVRAMPDFTPSRYLSIRTRVRCGKLLKAIVVYRKLVEQPERSLEVQPDDFEYLRFALLQSGPPNELLARFASEQDPREARQLKIIKNERDVFQRCLTGLDRQPFHTGTAPEVSLEPSTLATASLEELLDLLDRATDAGVMDVGALSQRIEARIIERGLHVSVDGAAAWAEHARLLERVEQSRGPVDPLLRFLRARGVTLLESAVERELLGIEALGEVRAARGARETVEALNPVVDRLQAFVDEAERAKQSTPQLSFDRLRQLTHTAASAMVNRLREAFLVEARAYGNPPWDANSSPALRLRGALEAVQGFEARLVALYPAFAGLVEGVVAPAVLPIGHQALAPLARVPRSELLAQFDRTWSELSALQLVRHLPVNEVLASTLVHAAQDDRRAAKLIAGARFASSTLGHDELRRAMPRSLLCFVAVQLCLRLDPDCVHEFAKEPRLELFAKRLAQLPAELRQEIREHDVLRLRVWTEFLERWLAGVTQPAELFQLLSVLEKEGAATRIRLETELIEAVLPDAKVECEALRGSLDVTLSRLRQLIEESGKTAAP